MTNIEHNFLKTNKKIKVFHSSVRKTDYSSRLIQTHLTFYLFSNNGILKVQKLCQDTRSKLEKQQLCFWDFKQKSKLLRALGVSERQMRRQLAKLKELGLVYEKFGNLHISHPFEGVGKYTLIPIRHEGVSILNKDFPLLEFVMQCIKADALCEHHAQCQLSFQQKRSTFYRKSAVLKSLEKSPKKVRRPKRILLVKQTTDFKENQKFKKFEERENAKKERFWVVPREKSRKVSEWIYCSGVRFKHTQEIHSEWYKKAKKQGAGFGLRWLEYAPNRIDILKKIRHPGELQGWLFKQAEKRVTGNWVTPTLFVNGNESRKLSHISTSGKISERLFNQKGGVYANR